jgi:hypothetical protein
VTAAYLNLKEVTGSGRLGTATETEINEGVVRFKPKFATPLDGRWWEWQLVLLNTCPRVLKEATSDMELEGGCAGVGIRRPPASLGAIAAELERILHPQGADAREQRKGKGRGAGRGQGQGDGRGRRAGNGKGRGQGGGGNKGKGRGRGAADGVVAAVPHTSMVPPPPQGAAPMVVDRVPAPPAPAARSIGNGLPAGQSALPAKTYATAAVTRTDPRPHEPRVGERSRSPSGARSGTMSPAALVETALAAAGPAAGTA